jgi:predicted negative regulator of RcsB-dependent stress response
MKIEQKGFGLISLILTVAIIGFLVYGGWYYSKDQKKNQLQLEQDAIQKAKDAASKENEYNSTIEMQNNLNTGDSVNYRSVQQKLK